MKNINIGIADNLLTQKEILSGARNQIVII
jgi:hypothetical protein